MPRVRPGARCAGEGVTALGEVELLLAGRPGVEVFAFEILQHHVHAVSIVGADVEHLHHAVALPGCRRWHRDEAGRRRTPRARRRTSAQRGARARGTVLVDSAHGSFGEASLDSILSAENDTAFRVQARSLQILQTRAAGRGLQEPSKGPSKTGRGACESRPSLRAAARSRWNFIVYAWWPGKLPPFRCLAKKGGRSYVGTAHTRASGHTFGRSARHVAAR